MWMWNYENISQLPLLVYDSLKLQEINASYVTRWSLQIKFSTVSRTPLHKISDSSTFFHRFLKSLSIMPWFVRVVSTVRCPSSINKNRMILEMKTTKDSLMQQPYNYLIKKFSDLPMPLTNNEWMIGWINEWMHKKIGPNSKIHQGGIERALFKWHFPSSRLHFLMIMMPFCVLWGATHFCKVVSLAFLLKCSVPEVGKERQTAVKSTFSFQRDFILAGNAAGGSEFSQSSNESEITGSFKG